MVDDETAATETAFRGDPVRMVRYMAGSVGNALQLAWLSFCRGVPWLGCLCFGLLMLRATVRARVFAHLRILRGLSSMTPQ